MYNVCIPLMDDASTKETAHSDGGKMPAVYRKDQSYVCTEDQFYMGTKCIQKNQSNGVLPQREGRCVD